MFNEEKTHAPADNQNKALCGASGHAVRRIAKGPHGVTCERCLRIMRSRGQLIR